MTLFCGPIANDNIAAHQVLGLVAKGPIEVVGETVRLAGMCLLPYVDTDAGNRFYSLESIVKFVGRRLSGKLLQWDS